MKNQYFGDISDYRKYGLLRLLSRMGSTKTAICWMLTPDDNRPEGKFITYLDQPGKWRFYEPGLFDCLKTIVIDENKRDVSEAQKHQIIPSALYFTDILPDEAPQREEYFSLFMRMTQGYDLVFFDPDNGIEVKSKPYGHKGSSKYLYWSEIKDAFSTSHSLLIYQHSPRIRKSQFVKSIVLPLAAHTGSQLIYSFQSQYVIFLLVCQEKHQQALQEAIQKVEEVWGEEFEIASHSVRRTGETSRETVSNFKFSSERVIRLRKRAQKACAVSEKGPQGWSKSDADPMKLLRSFPSLRMRKGFILRAYQYRASGDGNGIVWAMPEDVPFPDPEACPKLEDVFLEPPKPESALDIMQVIEGDGSPWSYLSASFFAREALEFGALWHGCGWSEHAVINKVPPGSFGKGGRWKWQEPKPSEWKPVVCEGQDKVTVTFYSYSGLGQESIYRHRDTYKPGYYSFKSERTVVAEGSGGYVL